MDPKHRLLALMDSSQSLLVLLQSVHESLEVLESRLRAGIELEPRRVRSWW